ncbi:uncharacterized protein LTR77_001932 [Saxophila tyrrhenica]|uniref:Uncharacterized protein n=1 Tax=Saxophila tyrrhenica TaxID=1690608 RepID=A0AAV9PLZ4_9PEZI|nr:hypothetical protein LTR77_001932 [Saxophila tyrrhenica]
MAHSTRVHWIVAHIHPARRLITVYNSALELNPKHFKQLLPSIARLLGAHLGEAWDVQFEVRDGASTQQSDLSVSGFIAAENIRTLRRGREPAVEDLTRERRLRSTGLNYLFGRFLEGREPVCFREGRLWWDYTGEETKTLGQGVGTGDVSGESPSPLSGNRLNCTNLDTSSGSPPDYPSKRRVP